MPKKLPPDSTIATVFPHLVHQLNYVRGVHEAMRQALKVHPNAFVRIGVTGTGQKPYYRVFSRDPSTNHETIYGSFYDNHDPLEEGFAITNNWSTADMSFEEVTAFLKQQTAH